MDWTIDCEDTDGGLTTCIEYYVLISAQDAQ